MVVIFRTESPADRPDPLILRRTAEKALPLHKSPAKYLQVRIVLALLIILAGSSCARSGPVPEKKAIAGHIDLSQHDFNQSPVIVLGGEWDLFRNRLIGTLAEAQSISAARVVLPQTWSGNGHATYRLKIRLPENRPESLALHMEAQLSAYDLSVGGKIIAASGKPGTNVTETIPGTRPLTAILPAGRDMEIFLRVANYHHRKGGIFKKIHFGTATAIEREIESKRVLDALLTGILTIMALYHFVIFALRRRNRAALLFALICMAIMGRTITTGEKLMLVMWPAAPFGLYTMLEYLSYFWSIPCAIQFFHELYPRYISRWVHRIFHILAALFSATVLVTPLSFYSHTSYIYMPVMLAAVLIVSWLLVRVTWHREQNAAALTVGVFVLALTVLNDSLNTLEILRTGYVVQFGFLGIVLIYASALAARFSGALDNSEAAGLKLQVANETLESRVAERTVELEHAKEIAEDANRLKDNFIALVSHDLRSPLSGLLGVLQTVRMAKIDEEKRARMLGLAEKSASDVLQMIESLLQLHRFKRGSLGGVSEPVQPYLVFDALARSLAEATLEKKLNIVNHIPPDWKIETDVHLLRHVLRNLLTNAIKYSHPGGEINVERAAENPPEISVTDHGVGMNPHQLSAVLGREQPVSTAGTAGEKGSGLGLAICREMLKSQGGDLSAATRPGKGSVFTIRLP